MTVYIVLRSSLSDTPAVPGQCSALLPLVLAGPGCCLTGGVPQNSHGRCHLPTGHAGGHELQLVRIVGTGVDWVWPC